MKKKLPTIVLILVATTLFFIWIKNEFKIDSCLDNGGKWDYEENKCIVDSNK